MTTFLQFHLLTAYPPSNPNRDDQGRPKQALVGGTPRLRLSSQSIKRALRESEAFAQLSGHVGIRTRRLSKRLLERLKFVESEKDKVLNLIRDGVQIYGKLDVDQTQKDGMPVLSTMAFVSPDEEDALLNAIQNALNGARLPDRVQLAHTVLRDVDGAIDIAMFGRMLAGEKADAKSNKKALDIKRFEREAAVQVSNAITTHQAIADEDFYVAIDDLNRGEELGAGFMGEAGFGSGVYYLYACVDVDLLVENLAGDRELASRGLDALARALATATPRGKQNSHAHRPRAAYVRAERGTAQPRDLSGAFFAPVDLRSNDLVRASIAALETMADRIDRAYGPACASQAVMNVPEEHGTLDEIAVFAAGSAHA